jgi:hypothetical protein
MAGSQFYEAGQLPFFAEKIQNETITDRYYGEYFDPRDMGP